MGSERKASVDIFALDVGFGMEAENEIQEVNCECLLASELARTSAVVLPSAFRHS